MTDIIPKSGEGVYLYDNNGNQFLDFTCGIGVTNTGHCHPKIVKAIKTTKLKVQSSINGQVVKVSGSKKDTLQETIEFLKKEFPSLPLTFDNFRD